MQILGNDVSSWPRGVSTVGESTEIFNTVIAVNMPIVDTKVLFYFIESERCLLYFKANSCILFLQPVFKHQTLNISPNITVLTAGGPIL